MKQLLLIFSLFTWSFFHLQAQDYTPVVVNGDIFYKIDLEVAGGPLISEITVADFDLFDGEVYNRVFLKRGFNPDELIGHVREFPSLGQLYFRPLGGSDQIVYDISLEVGDNISLSARFCDGENSIIAQVIAEETDEEGRRVLVFDRDVGDGDFCEPLRFIEGIGPNAGIILPYFAAASSSEGTAMRICHASRAGVVFYPPNVLTDFCGVPTTKTEEVFNQLNPAYPNPFRERVFLPGVEATDVVRLFATTGRLVGQWRGLTELEVGDLPQGMYVLVVERDGQLIQRERVVKLP